MLVMLIKKTLCTRSESLSKKLAQTNSSSRSPFATLRSALFMAGACGFLLAVAACGATVVQSTPYGIWLRKPLFGVSGGIEQQAREHCAQYQREATLSGDIDPGPGGNFRGILAYDCVEPRS
jgi:hypothetical protein